jgi:predicted nucleotidyltransferase
MSIDTHIPSADARPRIRHALAHLEQSAGITILFAAEGGSRAWGFPSPDSDYDVRFVYVRPLTAYLTLTPGRDVIDCTIGPDLDLVGWDLQKALRLLIAGNPTLIEWLNGPICYLDRREMTTVRELAVQTRHRQAAQHHHRSLAAKLMKSAIADRERVTVKAYLHALRSAAALAWLRAHPKGRLPIPFPAVLAAIPLPSAVEYALPGLLQQKAARSDAGDLRAITELNNWINAQIALAGSDSIGAGGDSKTLAAQADALLQRLILAALPSVLPPLASGERAPFP